MLTTYLVIGDRCWGKGSTEAEAIKVCKANAPARTRLTTYVTYLVPKDARVDDMGDLCWPSGDERPVKIRKVKAGKELPLAD